MHQGNYADALTVAEEAYDCVAVTYNPVHPDVQAAASILIGCLTIKGELYDAERLAKFTLDILKDPANKLDQESEAVANGYFDLAKVIYKQEGDLERAAMLVRESLRIRTLINHKDHLYVTYSASLLASILQSKKQLDKEMKEQLDHDLATNITNEGEEGINTVKSYINLGRFYHRYAHTFELTDNLRFVFLRYSEVNYRPAVRIYTKIHGLDNAITTEVSSALAIVSDELDLLEDARDALGDPRDA
jgi:tetratricopeptide (TPR) repeat protein